MFVDTPDLSPRPFAVGHQKGPCNGSHALWNNKDRDETILEVALLMKVELMVVLAEVVALVA